MRCVQILIFGLAWSIVSWAAPPRESDEAKATRLAAEAAKVAQEDRARAIELFEALIRLNKRLAASGDPNKLGHLAENYLWLGDLHRKSNRPDQAIDDARLAFSYSLKAGNRWYQVDSLNRLGATYRDIADFGLARESYEQAHEIGRGVSEVPLDLQIRALRNLAAIFRLQNDDDATIATLEEGRSLAERFGDRKQLNGILLDQGWDLQLSRDFRGALETYWRIFEAGAELDKFDEIHLYNRMASLRAATGHPADAWSLSDFAIQLARQARLFTDEIRLSMTRCQLTVDFPKFFTPSVYGSPCDETRELIRPLRDDNLLSVFLDLESQRLEAQGQLDGAIAAAAQAADKVDSLRFTLLGPISRARFLESRARLFRRLADLQMTAHQQHPSAGFDIKTLRVGDRLKARSLLDLWSVAGIDFLAKLPEVRRRELWRKRAELDRLAQAPGDPGSDSRISVLVSELDTFGSEVWKEQRGWMPPEALPLSEIQASLDPKTAIVQLLFGVKKSYLLVIRDRGPVRSFDLEVSPEELTQAADDYLRLLVDPNTALAPNELQAPGEKLARLLWGPHEERLVELPERLVFIGDGKLQNLPLYPLPRLGPAGAEGQLLIDSHEVVYLPSLSMIGRWRAREEAVGLPTHNAIVFGDPLYQLEPSGRDLVRVDETALKRYFPNGPEGLRLGRLPFADIETEKIRESFGKRPLTLALGLEASRDRVLAPETATYAIVHFASHGQPDQQHDELTSLRLSEVDAAGRPVDGALRLQDLYRVAPWRAHLVVASACQTGTGNNLRLEGAAGLAQGFLQAGAQRVVVSLWPVETHTTALLMERFYGYLLAGKPAGSALREASRDLRRLAKKDHKPWDAPIYWAPFILVGEWSSFSLPESGGGVELLAPNGVN